MKGIDWDGMKKMCFNDKRNPDDDELDTQIVRVSELLNIVLELIENIRKIIPFIDFSAPFFDLNLIIRNTS